MRDFEFRQRQAAKRKIWAKQIVSRWRDPESPEVRREVGRIATTHTFCGCMTCRWPKIGDVPTPQRRRSVDADSDACLDD
ncbi:MAG: hypothetical protein KF857_06375 [Fimbriimonadaceae bacterium]|nr:hypothetical protein [Fimbriimonadaceae bacterium]